MKVIFFRISLLKRTAVFFEGCMRACTRVNDKEFESVSRWQSGNLSLVASRSRRKLDARGLNAGSCLTEENMTCKNDSAGSNVA